MRTIKVPDPITLVDFHSGQSGDEVAFKHWLLVRILTDPKFGKTGSMVCMAADIRRKVDAANGVIELDEQSWTALRDVVEEPSHPYVMGPQIQLAAFITAVADAQRT
jgi:hypothetical protein